MITSEDLPRISPQGTYMVRSWSLVTSMIISNTPWGPVALKIACSRISPASLDMAMNGSSVGMVPPLAAVTSSMPVPLKIEDMYISVPWNVDSVLYIPPTFNINRKEEKKKHALIHDDAHRVVQQALAKDDRVQLRIDLVLREDAQDRDRVRCGERRAEDEALEERELEGLEAEECVQECEDAGGVCYVIC